ncbi:SDR family NAD(P)-dependent oxidoreductase [Clostridium uliginosum]|uniref:Gluconate 5-dehydrogenase n=1 Tax=Clostridium uliginosum TaxID=119641 RepID=A0A1I1HBA7_9CLOT|nr:glucose 1-dehydrogenase [Clostridium uliginosum]SFC21056.1 gluconate 5-dehydrogenase [Clostridium uliginosum]
MSNLFDLSGRVAIVTGASSGIGVQMAKSLAEHGADVAIFARREEKLKEVAKEIEVIGVKALPVKCDVTHEDEVKAAVATVLEKFGKIDILVNNAGVASRFGVLDLEENEWDRVMNTNVKSIYLVSKYVAKHMIDQKYGKIINTSSIFGIVGSASAHLHVYEASKGAVINLTKGMAASWAQYGITVNSIGPSLFKSEMTEHTLFVDSFLKMYNAVCPSHRPGKEGELNGAVIYFASDASNYTTGQILFVDGGWSAI